MARLLADEGFPLEATRVLRRLGHDVWTLDDLGLMNRGVPDAEVLAMATQAGRAVVTMNRRHFIRLHSAPVNHAAHLGSPEHAGIVVCRVNPDFADLAHRIDATLRGVDDLRGLLVRVNRG